MGQVDLAGFRLDVRGNHRVTDTSATFLEHARRPSRARFSSPHACDPEPVLDHADLNTGERVGPTAAVGHEIFGVELSALSGQGGDLRRVERVG